jgi:DNA-binding NarL/FixJ family response regulator
LTPLDGLGLNSHNYTTATETIRTQSCEVTAIEAEMIKLLIVEDQPDVRKGLQLLLAAESDLSVIGEASDGAAALDLAKSLNPDVVLMDVEMPHMDGIAATTALHLAQPQAAVIMLSIYDSALMRARARDAGAAAFVAKSAPADTLLKTIRQVAHYSGSGPFVLACQANSKEVE